MVKVPPEFDNIHGLEHIDKIVDINQSQLAELKKQLGKHIVEFLVKLEVCSQKLQNHNKRRKPGRFSFNVVGGRCETCQGAGMKA